MGKMFADFNLNSPLINALADLEFEVPTPIQERSFPLIMSGRDVVGIAQTGTGKTIAYLLPLLRMLKFSEQRHARILILVPTRELVLQVIREIEKLTVYMTLRVSGVYGGTNINTQKEEVYQGMDILVATPGRLYDLVMSGLIRLKSIQKLVIDEVDEMLNLGFRPQIMSLLELMPENRQNLMFSATLTEDVDVLIQDYFVQPEKIEIAPHGSPLSQIKQYVYPVPNFFTKINLIEYLLKNHEEMSKVLVFVKSKKFADRLQEELNKKGILMIGVIHSNKSQNLRINNLERFRSGELRVLISTDIVARGLDIYEVTHVINFDFPQESPDYIHRIGRTGRADCEGVAISLVNEAEREFLAEVESMMHTPLKVEPLPENLVISSIFTDDERPSLFDKNYMKPLKKRTGGPAFHEKKKYYEEVNQMKTRRFKKKS
jgi:ATP-dependent RNA helicase RhlE